MTEQRPFGDITLTLLTDATGGTLEGDRVFSPAQRQAWTQHIPHDSQGRVAMVVTCLLVSQGDHHTLIDTGYGEAGPNGSGLLLAALAEMGVMPKQIGRVILTHAHGDHCGGNTLHRDGRWLPTFPLAEYVVQAREVKRMRPAQSVFWTRNLAPLQDRGQLRLIEGPVELDSAIACMPTPGHTIGHQAVTISSGDQTAVFVGDLALFALNFQQPAWGACWAWSVQQDRQNRRRVADWAIERDALVVLGHDPDAHWVRLTANDQQGYDTIPA